MYTFYFVYNVLKIKDLLMKVLVLKNSINLNIGSLKSMNF